MGKPLLDPSFYFSKKMVNLGVERELDQSSSKKSISTLNPMIEKTNKVIYFPVVNENSFKAEKKLYIMSKIPNCNCLLNTPYSSLVG
jgi:hypothetical protein